MAEAELSEAGQRELEAGRAIRAKAMEEFAARTKGKPTPTQAENDEAAVGKYIGEHEADGSDPDPAVATRAMQGGSGASYPTRHVAATHARARTPASE